MICTRHQILLELSNPENEMGGPCGMYGRCERCIQGFGFDMLSLGVFTCFLYGCESWSLTLREEHRLRVYGNRVLKKYVGLRRTR